MCRDFIFYLYIYISNDEINKMRSQYFALKLYACCACAFKNTHTVCIIKADFFFFFFILCIAIAISALPSKYANSLVARPKVREPFCIAHWLKSLSYSDQTRSWCERHLLCDERVQGMRSNMTHTRQCLFL